MNQDKLKGLSMELLGGVEESGEEVRKRSISE